MKTYWNPVTSDRAILAYIDKMPPAISGSGGHNATFAVACVLKKKFKLSSQRALEFMLHYNRRCHPPWTVKELKHKVLSAPNG